MAVTFGAFVVRKLKTLLGSHFAISRAVSTGICPMMIGAIRMMLM